MKCPYCQKEMQLGYIPSSKQPVQWIPKDEKPAPIAFMLAEKGIPLFGKFAWRFGGIYTAEAYHCDKCNIVLAYTKPE